MGSNVRFSEWQRQLSTHNRQHSVTKAAISQVGLRVAKPNTFGWNVGLHFIQPDLRAACFSVPAFHPPPSGLPSLFQSFLKPCIPLRVARPEVLVGLFF